jgi:hypothetical protein
MTSIQNLWRYSTAIPNKSYNKNYEAFRLRGPRKSYQWKRISEVHKLMVDIQTAHAKLGSQDGNSREHEIKVPNDY